ncbi:MAG: Uncharacterized protein CEN89_286 [Candidatus Berkelbacteria bacterium Licking1014_7]|uniref:Uncharacterized protein n=1 Tax=Candidatus Berkelbacteria bacterium Licking1014_7 TaxID=2017147 RepID=A0A554LJI5_9BACT|nr:MAG: Uncharacterized protein CEN89_286 [Candidatus Berkelbacteria bacterium Licking1014_7]
MTIQDFAKQRPGLFWSTKNYDSLSEGTIVEAVLNWGNWDDVQGLFKILGIKKTAEIFRRQIARPRTNYDPKITNYFTLYFNRYA